MTGGLVKLGPTLFWLVMKFMKDEITYDYLIRSTTYYKVLNGAAVVTTPGENDFKPVSHPAECSDYVRLH